VSIPAETIHSILDESLTEEGIYSPPELGEDMSLDGLFSRVRRIRRTIERKTGVAKVRRVATKAFVPPVLRRAHQKIQRTAHRAIDRAERYGTQYGMAAARSRALGAGLGVAATAFPAVGGPALGAWMLANRAVAAHDQARRAMAAGRRLSPAALRNAQYATRQIQQIRRNPYNPRNQLMQAAYRSIR